MPVPDSKLKAARKKALEKGHWVLVSALDTLLTDTTSLDARINVTGAMHEVGLLSNSLAPYWTEWRSNDEESKAWAERCLTRLHDHDADYWALAALLAVPLDFVKQSLQQRGYKLLSIRFASTYKQPEWSIATFAGKHQDRSLVPVIEVGWDNEGFVIEASRWRAVILNEQQVIEGSLIGKGSGSYYMRAKLPYGCWRIADEPLELKEEWLVPKEKTLLADYP